MHQTWKIKKKQIKLLKIFKKCSRWHYDKNKHLHTGPPQASIVALVGVHRLKRWQDILCSSVVPR